MIAASSTPPRVAAWLAVLMLACATTAGPARYRLQHSGSGWRVIGSDRVLEDLRDRYPDFFEVVLDPETRREPDTRPLRDDLEHQPVDRRNFDALNTLAIGYFELNARAEAGRGGMGYLGHSFRTAKLVAVPWRAYGEVSSGALRDAILDFFEDAASGKKFGSATTASRLSRIVASLEQKEQDPERRRRIAELAEKMGDDR